MQMPLLNEDKSENEVFVLEKQEAKQMRTKLSLFT